MAFCAAVFVTVLVLASGNDSRGDSASSGLLVSLVVLAVLGSLAAVAWRSVTRKEEDRR